MIYGNIDGVKNSILNKLEKACELSVSKDSILSVELVDILVEVTQNLDREVSAAIDRKGQIISMGIGDSSTVELPIIDIREGRLSGVKIIHTHPNGNSRLSALDMSALVKLKLDCIVAIGVSPEKENLKYNIGFCGIDKGILVEEEVGPIGLNEVIEYDILDKIKYIEKLMKTCDVIEDDTERAILVGIGSEEDLVELTELARACNVETVDAILQNRHKIDAALYIGRGKAEEIAGLRQALRANLVIFDDELSGSQVRNLEEVLGCKVIDRTTLILEIFARRARTREAKIQVELAQLKYRLPRLTGLGTMLSRTGAGIGTRGPGEKKLEIDKRRIREGIFDLNKELAKIRTTRSVQREKRSRESISKVSLVGYTNSGKSTLRNALCDVAALKSVAQKDKVFEADMLFATLDVTTRALVLPDNRVAAVTDTVGFIRKLPHDLVEAFKSTLEEVVYSDLLLHVVDVSSETAELQIEAVDGVLTELNVIDKPVILVLNKIDKASPENILKIKEKYKELKCIEISAKNGTNLDGLLKHVCTDLPYTLKKIDVLIPYTDQSMVAYLHRGSMVDSEEYNEEGTLMSVRGDDEVYNKCKKYILN
ncbi:GTPase HflX [Clostridium estertheticum]|uniref:GTPase HflX n=1 Tax=Clostridium estertheticum TaxID=238834 RepID=A0A5N7IP35_9CLOT|nr:GTPase HflX [Clostridium estertheticum]MPQ32077.1 GTPase HflX [Clostridium estertheticum]MPQ62736.1 GTPase HflX [Clostridium estertheticum]